LRVQLKVEQHDQHFEENLTLFTSLLRREGLPVGTAEMIDALSALRKIDLSSRESFKAALRATMVKSKRDQLIFHRIFDSFFVLPEQHHLRGNELSRQQQELQKKIEKANLELQFKGEALRLSFEELQQYSCLSAEQRSQIKEFVQKTENGVNVEPQFRPILETIVKSHLRYCRNSNSQNQRSSSASGRADGSGSGHGIDEYLREMDIASIASADLSAAEYLLRKLSRKLAIKILRRRRSGPSSGTLDFRRSLRENLQYGGTIFHLKYRPKRRSRQQILLLCDVSASMNQYSTFVIHFLHGLQETVKELSCFTFSDNLENISVEIKGKIGLSRLLDRVVRRSKIWGGGTNIGQALKKMIGDYPDKINPKTTLIIVSDTKTVALESSLKELDKVKVRVKRIIWLNPLPVDRWLDYRSVVKFAEKVEMWPCSTINQLEEVLVGRL
jgi:uncharacterized protein